MKAPRRKKTIVVDYRIDGETKRQIVALAKRWNCSMTAAVVRCVERVYQQETKGDG